MDLPPDLRTFHRSRDIRTAKDLATTDSTNEDKASHSYCKLTSLICLEKKESPVNPYNRVDWTKMNSKWPLPDTDDNEINAVNSLPQLDCGAFPKSYMDTCSCCPRGIFDKHDTDTINNYRNIVLKDDDCCKTHWTRKERYQKIKAKVDRAVKRHKIFLIRGELPKLKEALEKRGWVQKYEATKTRAVPYGSVASLEARSLGDLTQSDGTLNEKAVIFALLRHKSPDFIWDCRNDFVDWHRGLSNNIILNRYQKPFVYTSKLGMARLLEEAHWLYEKDVSSVLFPRSYNLSREPKAFLDDFRLTAAAGLLKWFVGRMHDGQGFSESGHRPILMSRLEFAIKRCEEFIAREIHQNIDKDFVTEFSEEEWNSFLDDYTAAVHEGAGIETTSEKSRDQLQKYLEATNPILARLKEIDPQYELNGMRNIWILKPSELCCGTGISISHSLKDIFRKIKSRPKDYFIVQKYIERPLLIHDTKFDIRQWYLVTNTFPMTIWVFKEGLLRFSSKPYTFSTYHEAIHICNTAIQEKYDEERRRRRKRGNSEEVVKSIRDQGWDCEKLNEYLKQTGLDGEPYYDKIYTKMSEAIVLTMLASQEHMDRRRCSFELYGADFVVMEDLSVWLIEINTNPRMHPPSSRITKRLYSNVLESLVKVVMDVPVNPAADTGGFSLVYKQNIPDFRPYLGPCLFVFGKSITLQEHPRKREKRKKGGTGWVKQQHQQQQQPRAWTAPPMIPRLREPKIVDFIDYLNTARCTAAN
ncbi:tubulin glycylase 3A-like isoform X1 [Bombus vosnesenskii]|uniref:Tubulin glycylase 3A-like isoform X1 n=2 Tax=Bombus vosnesenskii TaxID=207650 RepID=A0A6J3K8M1_9HYME|nr:tubulin glycylase 3A-like isoform X1 [Bombus vosnesenskii]